MKNSEIVCKRGHKPLVTIAKSAILAWVCLISAISSSVAAPLVFFGEDAGVGEVVRLVSRPNSTTAQRNFYLQLAGTTTESFETFQSQTVAPITVSLGAAGSASLSGSGYVERQNNATSTQSGRYPSTGGQYWNVSGPFTITFSTPQTAMGFYATDVGDFSGQVTVTYVGGTTTTLQVPNTVNGLGGGILYFGFIDRGAPFTSVTFGNTAAGTDFFGFDDLTAGLASQLAVTPLPSAQILTFGLAPQIVVGSTGIVTTSGALPNSGNAVVYTSVTPTICSVIGNIVRGLAAGTCTINANQAGNTNFNAAPQAIQSFQINTVPQTLTFGTAPSNLLVGTSSTITATSAIPNSGNAITFISLTPAVCSVGIANGVVAAITSGVCVIAANQQGNATYSVAQQATQSFFVDGVAQTLIFTTAPAGVSVGFTVTVVAVSVGSNSGNSVLYSSQTPLVCTVNGSTGVAVALAPGLCTIAADQAGNATFAAALQAFLSFNVVNAPPLAVPGLRGLETILLVMLLALFGARYRKLSEDRK